ncbi:hypothetical protein INT45_008909 [Circinella minor]|uniref:Glutathione S-transferase C-terminal domain-containing protein n=1 Tax=Circinella minor TaxID=1195481 RepID=A0A8H7VFX9_9FUNG|nr:hypothetical protein INT45_008909 [Circinella minor]
MQYKTYFNNLLLEQSSTGPYFLGKEYSAVGVALAPFFFQITSFMKFLTGKEYEVPKELPRLHEFLKGIMNHPAYKETAYLDDEEPVVTKNELGNK